MLEQWNLNPKFSNTRTQKEEKVIRSWIYIIRSWTAPLDFASNQCKFEIELSDFCYCWLFLASNYVNSTVLYEQSTYSIFPLMEFIQISSCDNYLYGNFTVSMLTYIKLHWILRVSTNLPPLLLHKLEESECLHTSNRIEHHFVW